MTVLQSAYRQRHQGEPHPLLHLYARFQTMGPPDAAAIRTLAAEVGLPEATVRSVYSYYSDLHGKTDVVHVCHGTSCLLAGADELHTVVAHRHESCPVYCLGYCDRSPAVLSHEQTVRLGTDAYAFAVGTSDPAPRSARLSIRCLADEPLVLRRVIRGDFSALHAARADGAYEALRTALDGPPEAVMEAVERSGERGRGGAGFPTGTKWRLCAEATGTPKYVVANGEEGDPGSFVDRVLMEDDPHSVLEGLILCGYAVGAREGILFIRSAYPQALVRMRAAVEAAYDAGVLGASVLGSDFAFDVTVFPGLGSYVCGEETALLNAIEGLRGEVRLRPPYPTDAGLYGQPTVVNNVETLVNIPVILERGPEAYAALGTAHSSGTKVLCLNHGFARPGLVEVAFGVPLREVVDEAGGGADGRRLDALLLGGPMGSVLVPDDWDVPVCYGAMAERGIQLGHGGMVALPEGTDYRAVLNHLLRFMVDESCGKCVPCRLGSGRAWRMLHDGAPRQALLDLLGVIEAGSLCAFGQSMPGPMRQLVDHFGEHIYDTDGQL